LANPHRKHGREYIPPSRACQAFQTGLLKPDASGFPDATRATRPSRLVKSREIPSAPRSEIILFRRVERRSPGIRSSGRRQSSHGSGGVVQGRVPDHLRVHAKILMHDNVAKTDDFGPGNAGVAELQFG